MPTNRGMNKEVQYIYSRLLISHQVEDNPAICDQKCWMDLEGIRLQINQTERQIWYDLTYI